MKSRSSAYAARLAAFEALEPGRFTPVWVRWQYTDTQGGVHGVSERTLSKRRGYTECACCGNKRLKNLWPVRDSQGTVYWIGEECWKNLDSHGKLGPTEGCVEIEE